MKSVERRLPVNDLAAAVSPARIIANHRTLLERIRAESPSTETDVAGVLPVDRTFQHGPSSTTPRSGWSTGGSGTWSPGSPRPASWT
jgi:hypothetical protein